jgi:hypothetical protein
VVVTSVAENRGQKNDELDAYELADRLRRGALQKVFEDEGRLTTLRQMVKVHATIVRDTVRVQNRIKALYRSRGVNASGERVLAQGKTGVAGEASAEQPGGGRSPLRAAPRPPDNKPLVPNGA